jgi:VanZ family protein
VSSVRVLCGPDKVDPWLMMHLRKPMQSLLPILHPFHRWGTRHIAAWYTLPLVIWIAGLAFFSLMPPGRLPSFSFDLGDKLQHAVCYLLLSVLLLRGYLRNAELKTFNLLMTVFIASLWGLYLEYLQEMTPYRTFDWWDAFSNFAGSICGVIVWKVWRSETFQTAFHPKATPSTPLEEGSG